MTTASAQPVVRTYRAKFAGSRLARLNKSAPLAAGETILFESEGWIKSGSRVAHVGMIRLTGTRLLVSVGKMPFVDQVIEIPRALFRVEPVMATMPLAGPERKTVAVRYHTGAGEAELLLWAWGKLGGDEYARAGAARKLNDVIDTKTEELFAALSRPM